MMAARRKVLHPDFLGAHRYTTARGGIVRPAGGVLRTAVACLRQSKGEATLLNMMLKQEKLNRYKARRRRNPKPEPRPHLLQLKRMKLNGAFGTSLMRIPPQNRSRRCVPTKLTTPPAYAGMA